MSETTHARASAHAPAPSASPHLQGDTAVAEPTHARASAQTPVPSTSLNLQKVDVISSNFQAIAQHMFMLMMRNMASDGYVFVDPTNSQVFSRAGCIIASPSYPANTATIDQDYVFNWVRDAALTVLEIAATTPPTAPGQGVQSLIDYVAFAQLCLSNGTQSMARGCFTIAGQPRAWSDQNDGPALQTVALLAIYPQLNMAAQQTATEMIATNLQFLLGVYQQPTTNLWEEHNAYSFFARAAQLRCFEAVKTNTLGIAIPDGVDAAITWLKSSLDEHWSEQEQIYMSLLPPIAGYDPNIDIICASLYGAIPFTDTRLLATAAKIRSVWADDGSPHQYPINVADRAHGMGPLLGRYPSDFYDGDARDGQSTGNHPWALCTCNLAELYYHVSNAIAASQSLPLDPLSEPFFSQVGITAQTSPADAVNLLHAAADAMLNAVIYHSDHLELSEQFDGYTGYEKSVKNLTWSYASFLSAVRAKTSGTILGVTAHAIER